MSIGFRLEWTRDIHQRTNRHTLAITDFGIIVSERNNYLAYISKETGQTIWKTRTSNPWGWLAVADTYVAYLQHRVLQCFNLESGETLWQHDVDDRFGAYLVAKDHYLIIGGWHRSTILTCMDVTSGRRLWLNPIKHDYAPPVISPWGVILSLKAADQLKSLQLLDYEQGKIEFEVDIPAKVPAIYAYTGIQMAGGILYATTLDGEIYSLDLKQQRWTLRAFHAQGIRTTTPSYINGCILFLDQEKQLCCYDLKNGQMKWQQALDHKNEFLPATHYENIFIIGTSEGHLIAVDDLGNRIWARTVGKRIRTPLFIDDGRQLILGTNGAIVSYRLVNLASVNTQPTTG